MLRHFHLNSSISLKPLIKTRAIFTSSILLDESNSDDNNAEAKKSDKNKESLKKLNDLLKIMAKKEEPTKLASQIKIPKPRETKRQEALDKKKLKESQIEKFEKEKLGNQLAEAATKVAECLGGDTKKTEIELLEIYLTRHKKPGDSDEHKSSPKSKVPLSNLLSEMKIEKEKISPESSRAQLVKSLADKTKPQQFIGSMKPRESVKINIFDEKPFGYFNVEKIKEQNVTPLSLATWDHLHQRDLKLAISHPPRNIFEQLIQWTEQGKIWKFPIDNEQDWHEEAVYDFTDHVFLERWLEPWCPENGPIRYFMELVCVGLSKNPYLTVPEKQAHIFWYEHYFRSKKDLLLETNAGEIKDRVTASSSNV